MEEEIRRNSVRLSISIPIDPRSKAKYNIISRLFLLWIEPLFWLGCHRQLSQKDLYAHPKEADSKKLLMRFNEYWKTELSRKYQGKSPRLLVAVLKCFWAKLILQGLLLFSEVVILIVQSILLGYLTDQFTNSDPMRLNSSNITSPRSVEKNAYYFATGLSGTAFLIALVLGHTYLVAYKNGMISRIAVTGAIYQKILSLNLETLGQISSGYIINLASNDVQRLDLAFIFIHTVWIAPLHLGVVMYLIYLEIGWYTFIVTGIVCLQVPLQVLLAKLYSYLRLKSAKFTDRRVRIMKEVIAGIRVIKMYTWEHAFKQTINNTRRQESGFVLQAGLIRAIGLGFMITFINIVIFFTFTIYTSTGGQLSPRKVFISISLVLNLRLTTVHFFIQNVLGMVEAKVAATRIQKILETDEFSYNNQVDSPDNTTGLTLSNWRQLLLDQDSVMPEVDVSNLTVSWTNDDSKLALKNVSFQVNQVDKLLAVIGPVGSGKSTLLYSLLNEIPSRDGNICLNGKISYASQDPWVFAATIKENILFGEKFNRKNYEKVLKACALDKDIENLEKGDLTLVGERGVTLSGGQKARVNLARAVYRDADIYLLDDPLSAVDAAVGADIFHRCLLKLLADKLVILATHQVHFAIMANKILVLKNGETAAYGSHTKLMARGLDVTQICPLPFKRKQTTRRKSRMSMCPISPYLECVDNSMVGMDGNRQGGSSYQLRRGAITSPMKFVDNRIDTELFGAESCFFDVNSNSLEDDISEEDEEVQQPPEESERGALSTKVYVDYFKAGGILATLAVIIVFIIGEAGIVISEWWLSNWAVCEASEDNSSTFCSFDISNRLQVYSGLTLFTIFVNFARTIGFVNLCINASQVLHDKMFQSLLQSPVLFFDSNTIGRILNRFSKDVGFLDDLLPHTFCEFFLFLFRCFAILATTLVTNPLLSLPAFFLLLTMLLVRWYFLKTSREIKRLEALARSPVYSHLSTTLQGLPTIRASRKQNIVSTIFQNFQNQHTQGWYLYLVTTRWLGMRVDTLSALFVTVFTFMSVGLASFTNNLSVIGLGLTYVISLSGLFQYVVRQSAEIEDLMISGERIMAYSNLEPEAPLKKDTSIMKPASNWPSKGGINMNNVSFQYNPEIPPALRNLAFSINPSEKIGIVGRTGAGKSSLISVLYRLAEFEGQVTIDGVDIQSIGLHDLRKKMSIIPQDPVLFSGTVKYNLDPFNEYSDVQLWKSLEQVQLSDFVSQMEGQLHGEVLEGGSNFSVGQRQLVCLARALLRKNKILILDEATANIDPRTDNIIQGIIREAFSGCTVLTIAHRLNTVMDSDRIMVIEDGEVVEFDTPITLINKGSHFAQMVEKTGVNAAHNLCQLAIAADSKPKHFSNNYSRHVLNIDKDSSQLL